MYCISINYKNAGAELRQEFAFSEEAQAGLLRRLTAMEEIEQCVLLCTCSRTELYFTGEERAIEAVVAMMADHARISGEEMLKSLLFYYDDKAVQHLFMVAGGIESMVIGEDEILGQTRDAYTFAKEQGTVGYELNVIFQAAIACAKKIKTETVLSKTSVSTATLAAARAAKIGDRVNVLVIGASGKIGTTVVKNLASYKHISVTATQRVHKVDFGRKQYDSVRMVDYHKRYDYIQEAGCIISATSSPHYTITRYDLEKKGIDVRGKVFIDMAVPPDIDKSISLIPGAEVIGIDYFEEMAAQNNIMKQDGVAAAKEIIAEEIDTLKKDMLYHNFRPCIPEVKERVSSFSLEEIIYRMKADISSGAFEEVLHVIENI